MTSPSTRAAASHRRRRPRTPAGVLLCGIVLAGSAGLADAEPEFALLASYGGSAIKGKFLRLSLREAIARALERSPTLALKRTQELETQIAVDTNLGAFVPTLTASTSFSRERAASYYAFNESESFYDQTTFGYQLALGGVLPIGSGLSYSLGLQSDISWSTLGAAWLDPRHANRLQLQLKQPLLRGVGRHTLRSELQASRLDQRASLAETRAVVAEQLLQVSRAYWQLATRQEEVAVAERAQRLTEGQLELGQRRLRAGTLSQLELLEIEARLASRRQLRSVAELARTAAEKELLLLIDSGELASLGRALWATDRPAGPDGEGAPTTARPALDALVSTALRERPELAAVGERARAAGLRLETARNAALPRLDLEGTIGLASLAGESTCTPVPNQVFCPADALRGGQDLAWRQLVSGKMPFGQIGLKLELPLSSAVRTSEARARELALRRLQLEAAALRARIIIEVRDASLRRQESGRRLAAADRSAAKGRSYLAEAQKKFSAGLGTADELLRAQEALITAEREQVQARAERAIQQAELQAALGSLPASLGVQVR